MNSTAAIVIGALGIAAILIGSWGWWGLWPNWTYTRKARRGWMPLLLIAVGIGAACFAGALEVRASAPPPTPPLASALFTLTWVFVIAGVVFFLAGAPYALLSRWIRRRVDAGDPVIQPYLPAHLWPHSTANGRPPLIVLSSPDDASPTSRRLLTSLRTDGSVTLPTKRSYHLRLFVIALFFAITLPVVSFGMFADGEVDLALPTLTLAGLAILTVALKWRLALVGGVVVAGREGLTLGKAEVRWEEVAGVGVQEGTRGKVTLALQGVTAEDVEVWGLIGSTVEDDEARAILPVLRENPWEVAEFLALAHAELVAELPAPPAGVPRATWVQVVGSPGEREALMREARIQVAEDGTDERVGARGVWRIGGRGSAAAGVRDQAPREGES